MKEGVFTGVGSESSIQITSSALQLSSYGRSYKILGKSFKEFQEILTSFQIQIPDETWFVNKPICL